MTSWCQKMTLWSPSPSVVLVPPQHWQAPKPPSKQTILGEEFEGPENLGLAPKVLQNLWGSAEPFFKKLSHYAKHSAEPSCRTPKGSAELWGTFWEPLPVLSGPANSSPKFCSSTFRGLIKGWFSKRVVLADVPPERKPERGYIRMFLWNENRNEGTFACSPGTKTGTRAYSPKPPFSETALLSSSEHRYLFEFWCSNSDCWVPVTECCRLSHKFTASSSRTASKIIYLRDPKLTIRRQTISMHHQNVLWFEPGIKVVSLSCMALWAPSKIPLQTAPSKRIFYLFWGVSLNWIFDFEWVVSARAHCQGNPSSTNFALTAPTETPNLPCSKQRDGLLPLRFAGESDSLWQQRLRLVGSPHSWRPSDTKALQKQLPDCALKPSGKGGPWRR